MWEINAVSSPNYVQHDSKRKKILKYKMVAFSHVWYVHAFTYLKIQDKNVSWIWKFLLLFANLQYVGNIENFSHILFQFACSFDDNYKTTVHPYLPLNTNFSLLFNRNFSLMFFHYCLDNLSPSLSTVSLFFQV